MLFMCVALGCNLLKLPELLQTALLCIVAGLIVFGCQKEGVRLAILPMIFTLFVSLAVYR